MRFQTAKRLVMALFMVAVILILAAMLLANEMSGMLLIIGIIVFVGGLVIVFMYCRCPSCGALIFRKLFVLKVCPNCKRDLATGVKVKNSKKK